MVETRQQKMGEGCVKMSKKETMALAVRSLHIKKGSSCSSSSIG